jgi:arylsulfatase A-like enzyme
MNVIVILCDTLRRDHVGAYTGGVPLNEAWSADAPPWRVPTPNMDRLAARGTTFDNCFCGSSPCMPARRDLYTGRYEFPWRGWGPLDEDDAELPRQISGPPNRSIHQTLENGYNVSYMVTDHFHLWEQGSGNYHMGYTGFEFIRGIEADAWYTSPYDGFDMPEADLLNKNERHWRNKAHIGYDEEDTFPARTFKRAAKWLEDNHGYEDFYLHIDSFPPHEPWDPPKELVEQFMPGAYEVEGWHGAAPYCKWRERMGEDLFNSYRARYAANVVLVDRWLGHFLDTMDRLNLWEDTLVIFTTDHGTYNGDHGRIGKLQTHQHDAVAHTPFIVAHPTLAHGEHRDQLVQIVDIYPTALSAIGRPIPEDRHGVDLLPVLEDANAKTRDYAIYGIFGSSVTITDGEWVLHQSPNAENGPLNWYSPHPALFLHYDLGPYDGTRREVNMKGRLWTEETWLSHKPTDMNELNNLAGERPDKVREMQRALKEKFAEIGAPDEQLDRLGLRDV